MKGDERLIQALDGLLVDELTAINQYFVHAEMCENWGYDRLHESVEKRAIQEMKHAEKLIARIIFLDGAPTVSRLNAIHIGPEVPKQFELDLGLETMAIRNYNAAIRLAHEVGDAATKNCWKRSSRMRTPTSMSSKSNWTRSPRWEPPSICRRRIAHRSLAWFHQRREPMLYWALIFLIVALVAGWMGYGQVAGTATWVAKVLFVLFVILFLVSLLTGILHRPMMM